MNTLWKINLMIVRAGVDFITLVGTSTGSDGEKYLNLIGIVLLLAFQFIMAGIYLSLAVALIWFLVFYPLDVFLFENSMWDHIFGGELEYKEGYGPNRDD